MPDIVAAAGWWIVIQIMGLAAWPLAFQLLRWLPDRGYTLAKPLGLLLVSYFVWLLASLRIVPYSPASILLALALVAGLSGWAYRRRRTTPRSCDPNGRQAQQSSSLVTWLREHRWLIISYELILASAFVGWAMYRAFLPDIVTSDKMMDLAIYNVIGRSTYFPPQDPWLAGYTISYYYFGYLIMSVLGKLTGITAGMAHSLTSALWFALSAASAFGLVVNLVLLTARKAKIAAVAFGVVGAIMLVIMGNLEAPLEVARVAGWGTPEFWTWLDIEDLKRPYTPPPPGEPAWPPGTREYGWWWRASRVIHDYKPTSITPRRAAILSRPPDDAPPTEDFIDEFPQFIYLLGDTHAHVLNMPYVLLSIGLALNVYQAGSRSEARSLWRGGQHVPLWLIYPVVLGALGFINAWDFPIYSFLVAAAFALGQWTAHHFSPFSSLGDFLLLGGASVLVYLPYYISSQQQGFGIWPNIFYGTRAPQFFVMFGPFIVCGALFGLKLLSESVKAGRLRIVTFALKSIGGGVAVLVVTAAAATALGIIVYRVSTPLHEWFEDLVAQMSEQNITIADHLLLRASDPWLPLAIASSLAAIVLLWRARRLPGAGSSSAQIDVISFILLLFLTGLLLTLSVEAVYVPGMEKQRANTGFKFYFQVWILWSVASAYATYHLLASPARIRSGLRRVAAGAAIAGVIGLGLMYPVLAIPTRIEPSTPPMLDAALATARSPRYQEGTYDAYLAVQWINQNVPGTPFTVEATDDVFDYRHARSRVSSWSGLPTLLGWYWHEVQWRGDDKVQRQRLLDITTIYSTTDAELALSLLRRYDVSYVIVGRRERRQYPAEGLAKFDQLLPVAYRQGAVTIYRVTPSSE